MDYFSIYRDVWQFHKQHIDRICDDEEFWEGLIAEADKLCEKYGNSRFIRDLVLAEMAEFERIYEAEKT